jgi:hypothetical protein
MVTVDRHLDPEDYKAFGTFVARSAGGPSLVRAGLILAVLLAAPFVVFALLDQEFDLLTAAVTAVLMFGWIVAMALWQSQTVVPTPDGLLLEPSTLMVDEAGLTDRGERAESVFRWAAVRRVAVTEGHVFIMFDQVVGLIVPFRCFEDEAAEDAFLREFRRLCPPEVPFEDQRPGRLSSPP